MDQSNISLFSGDIQVEATFYNQPGVIQTQKIKKIGELQSRMS
jgi:hypothetical protein